MSNFCSALTFASAAEVAALIKRGEISSLELLEHYFSRIDKYDSQLNAIVWQQRDEARTQAKAADGAIRRGEDVGALHGVPMTIKESYDVVGYPTTWGRPDLKDNFPQHDALAVARLKKAGAIIFGKTNVPYGLADFQSYNEIYGTTNNPWDLARSPGGSSGGSAVSLAVGFSALDAGSDIGGSIRNPAHFCGLFGHKPTWNLVPPRGHALPGTLAPADLSVIGPLARSANDLELALKVMAGPDEIQSSGLQVQLPPFTKKTSELRVAVWEDEEIAPVAVSIRDRVGAVAETLGKLGANVEPTARPEWSAEAMHNTYQCLLNATMTCRVPPETFKELLAGTAGIDEFGCSSEEQAVLARVARFRNWVQYNEERTKIRWAWHNFFQTYDILIAPIMATPAFAHDHRAFSERTISVNGREQAYFTQLFWAGLAVNAYLPSTVIPTGLESENKLPIGVQIIGPEYSDLITIGIAQLMESEGYTFTPPPLFP
ncbi:MAG: amidase [Gammaproteobacteria bacterium]|nr:amidase [Gammaproteobacteria bacterium]